MSKDKEKDYKQMIAVSKLLTNKGKKEARGLLEKLETLYQRMDKEALNREKKKIKEEIDHLKKHLDLP
ncbi:protein of unknown function [Tenacibaculum sp. 190524A02b]|uniref:hypothetical protein n=1 Tax=Tenacibaculum vairaonense TaxID=3137860 RepID=UPI0032B11243